MNIGDKVRIVGTMYDSQEGIVNEKIELEAFEDVIMVSLCGLSVSFSEKQLKLINKN